MVSVRSRLKWSGSMRLSCYLGDRNVVLLYQALSYDGDAKFFRCLVGMFAVFEYVKILNGGFGK